MKSVEQAKKEILASGWTVKNVKYMKGHDADSMECSLYFRNKRVATVWDDSWGGGFDFTWRVDMEKEFSSFASQFTVPSQYFEKGQTYNMDIVVDVLATEYDEIKRFRNPCKKKTLFTLKSDPPYVHYTMNTPFTPDLAVFLKGKYGKDLKEIINTRYA